MAPDREYGTRAPVRNGGGARPLRADAARNRERVLAAAKEAFEESGLGVPLDEIARRAGVGPGTVYRHFPAKEALFEAVVEARVQDLVDDAARRRANEPDEAFFGFLGRLAHEATFKRNVSDALAGSAGVAAGVRERMYAALSELLVAAQDAGAVPPDVTTPDLIALLKGMITALREAQDDAARERLVGLMTAGLRAPS